MKIIKDNTIQIQDTNGKNYSIPLEDLISLTVYSDDHKHRNSIRTIKCSLRYVYWETLSSDEIPYDKEIDVDIKDCNQLMDYLEKNKSFNEPRLSNVYKITYFVTGKGTNLDDNK